MRMHRWPTRKLPQRKPVLNRWSTTRWHWLWWEDTYGMMWCIHGPQKTVRRWSRVWVDMEEVPRTTGMDMADWRRINAWY